MDRITVFPSSVSPTPSGEAQAKTAKHSKTGEANGENKIEPITAPNREKQDFSSLYQKTAAAPEAVEILPEAQPEQTEQNNTGTVPEDTDIIIKKAEDTEGVFLHQEADNFGEAPEEGALMESARADEIPEDLPATHHTIAPRTEPPTPSGTNSTHTEENLFSENELSVFTTANEGVQLEEYTSKAEEINPALDNDATAPQEGINAAPASDAELGTALIAPNTAPSQNKAAVASIPTAAEIKISQVSKAVYTSVPVDGTAPPKPTEKPVIASALRSPLAPAQPSPQQEAAPKSGLHRSEDNTLETQSIKPEIKASATQTMNNLAKPAIQNAAQKDIRPKFETSSGFKVEDAQLASSNIHSSETNRSSGLTTTQTSHIAGANIPRQIGAELMTAIRNDRNGVIDIQLQPEELGRVQMRLSFDGTAISVSISAERGETSDFLRRNIELLQREIAEAGYEDVSFQFSADGGDSEENPEANSEDKETYFANSSEEGVPSSELPLPMKNARHLIGDSVDIRM